MLWLSAALSASICDGIPGGMYDLVDSTPTHLLITMRRTTKHDASARHLEALFEEPEVRIWYPRPDHSAQRESQGAWVEAFQVPIPPGSTRVNLRDRIYKRDCLLALHDGVWKVSEVRAPRRAKYQRTTVIPLSSEREDLTTTIDVHRSKKARHRKRNTEEPPPNLELRATLLAKLNANLVRMHTSDVIEWMKYQGFKPDDEDVIRILGSDYLQRTLPSPP